MALARPDTYSIPSGGTLSAGGLLGTVAAPLTVGHYLATPEQITFNCPLSRPLADGTAVRLYYKLPLSTTWLEAHPLLYVRAAEVTSGGPNTTVDACKGAIFDLVPGQTYDWKIVGTEPGVGTWEASGQRATRALPPAAGAPTVNATTASNLQTLLNALTPGAVLQLANGTYTLSTFLQISAAGTESQPIYIRGQSRDGVILACASGVAVQVYTGAYTVIENLTIQGSGTDSGTASTSVGVEFWAGGAAQQGITIRDVKMTGVDKGVSTINARQALVYNCDLAGNNTWALAYQDNGGQTNLTWNDDGMLLAGEGNCCWATKLDGFGDATASGHASSGGRANFFYRLEIPMTGDDGHEFDYTDGPCAFYDCRIGNSGTVASWQPTFGGPAFAFRNVAANSIRGPWKLNDVNAGALIYCNTVVRTPGATGFGLYQSGQGGAYFQRSMSHRGNLYALRGSPTEVLRFDSLCDRLDWTHNGYTQDGSFNWSASGGGATASLAAARAALPTRATLFGTGQRHANDIIVSSANPWTETVTLGADHTTRFTGFPSYVLAGGSNALGAGVHIPGITDGYSGAAPALGAVIPGRALVAYGVPVSLWSAPAAGFSAQIGYASGAHPSALPATPADINPASQSWGTGSPWAGTGPRGSKAWTTRNDYGSVTWAQTTRQAVSNGGGHVGYCAPAPQAWDAATLSCKWLAIPVPSDGLSQMTSDNNTPSGIAAVYPAGQFDTTWGEWLGDYTGISAPLRQPGKVFPEVAHAYYGQFWVPGSAHGNTNGALVLCNGMTGNGTSTGIPSGHLFDMDTAAYVRTANRRAGGISAAAGGTIYHPGVGKGFAITSVPTAALFSYDVYDPATRTWVQRSATNETIAITDSGGLGAYFSAAVPAGLLLNFIPVNAGGTFAYNLAVRHRIDAMSATAAAAGGGTWSTLTVTGSSWPTIPASLAGDISSGDTAAAIGWCFAPPKDAFYAVDGRNGSTTLWKLSPPAGATTVSALLSGTWTISTETISGPGLLSRKSDGTGAGTRFVYQRLVWDSAAGCLIFFPECLTDRPTAITPA